MSAAVTILDWHPLRRNALVGFAKVELPSGMIISGVTILAGSNGPWASPPSKPQIGRDGTVLEDQNGEVEYSPIIEFKDKATRNRFSDAVIKALRAVHPEALA